MQSIPNYVSTTRVLLEVDGLSHEVSGQYSLTLAHRYSQRMESEIGWFEKFISHGPSVGSFYENLVRTMLDEIAGSRYKVGEGFVFDTHLEQPSRQLDIIIYDDSLVSPIYRSGRFVVVPSSCVFSVGEIKKSLSTTDIRGIIRNNFFCNLGTGRRLPTGVNILNVFSLKGPKSLDRMVKIIEEEINIQIARLLQHNSEGKNVSFGTPYVVLPAFYFGDRQEFISTSLKQEAGKVSSTIEISAEQALGGNNGLPEFLYSMSASGENNVSGGEKSFLAPPFRSEVGESRKSLPIFVYRRLTMDDFIHHYEGEIRKYTAALPKDEFVYGAIVGSWTDLSKIETLSALTKEPGFHWLRYNQGQNSAGPP